MATCILTTKDISILEIMLERNPEQHGQLARLLRSKIDGARVVFREDAPETVATLNSRVSYRIDGGEPDSRIISQTSMSASVGRFLPITTLRGLALLGMMQGQKLVVPGHDGADETVELLRVLHQPEASQRKMRIDRKPAGPVLRLIFGGKAEAPTLLGNYDDDPGPSAA